YLGSGGAMKTNDWAKDKKGVWYYVGADGAMKTNSWEKDSSGKWYYVGANGAMKVNDWEKDSKGKWYYLGADGAMKKGGFVDYKGDKYFVDADGVMQTGVIKIKDLNGVYCFGENGAMKTGKVKIDGVEYNFDKYGKCTDEKLPKIDKIFNNSGSDEDKSGSKEEEKVEKVTDVNLSVWAPMDEQDFLRTQCDAFNAAHPEWNITFNYGVCSASDAKDAVIRDLDAAADVFYYHHDQMNVLVSAGAVAEFAGTYKDQIAAVNDEVFMNTVTYDGKVYGVPFTSNTWFMYYDKSVFSEEDVKSLETMLEKGKVWFPLKNSWCTPAFYLANGTLFGEAGNDAAAGVSFADEMGVATTKYLAELVKNPNFGGGDMYIDYLNQGYSAVFSGSWDANNVKDILGDNMGVAVAPTITINGVTSNLRPYGGTQCIGVNSKTSERGNQAAATALAVYLGSEEVQQARYDARQINPTIATVTTGSDVATVEIAQMALSFPQPMIPEMYNVWSPFQIMAEELLNGDVNDGNAKEKTVKMVKRMIASGL
ncbi:MAG: extracellular solute-binding protein, partial [Lachnospiraceae bacterium]|nr:extracellular solute-binding protein [Lachnospiraceae bacterium]